jgi:hypothetical protein
MRLLRASSVLATLVMLACTGSEPLVTSSGVDLLASPVVYTLVNLHPDEQRSRLYAVNYQQAGLIPVCSEVKIVALKGNQMRFQVVKTGREYAYLHHKKAAAEPFNAHLLRFFGTECDRKGLERLAAGDRAGVQAGKVEKGMSRQGVIFAMGYPPRHETPDLNGKVWKYWRSKFDTMLVTFDDKGRVESITN